MEMLLTFIGVLVVGVTVYCVWDYHPSQAFTSTQVDFNTLVAERDEAARASELAIRTREHNNKVVDAVRSTNWNGPNTFY